MEDERPVPLVLIEDWNTTDYTWHNSQFAGQAVDPDDGVEKRYFRFYWSMRVDLLIRHHDDVQAHRLLDEVRKALIDVKRDPLAFHGELNALDLRGSGGIQHQFLESKETELQQSFRVTSFHEVKDDNYDTLEEIVNDFTLKEI